jgi:hypothetical protein
VSDVVCAFTGFALLEDRSSRSCLVKIGFDAMRRKLPKAISFAFVHQIEISKGQ